MKDFWYTFLAFTGVGLFLASFVRFIFFLAMFGYTGKFFGVVALFVVLGLIAGFIAQRYKIVTYLIDRF